MKKYIKKICFLFFSFCIIGLCCGCSNIDYSINLKSNGSITAKINVDLTSLNSSNRQTINLTVQTYYKQLDKKYEENLIALFSNVYDFEALSITSSQKKIEYIYSQQSTKFLVGDTEYKTETQYPYILIEKQFVSVYAYLLYFYPSAFEYNCESNSVKVSNEYKAMIDVPLSSGLTEEDCILYEKYIQSCQPFMYNGEEPKFLYDNLLYGIESGQTLANYLEARTLMSQDDVEYIFNFSTPYRRLHSNGIVTQSEDGYLHSWVLGSVQDEVYFWRNYAKSVPFYLIAVCCGIIFLIIGCIFVIIKRKIKKRKGLITLKKIDELQNKS